MGQKRNEKAVRETIVARVYSLTIGEITHEVQAASASELTEHLQKLGGGARSVQLARLVWADDQADVRLGNVGLVALGRVVKQMWGKATPVRLPQATQESSGAPLSTPDFTQLLDVGLFAESEKAGLLERDPPGQSPTGLLTQRPE